MPPSRVSDEPHEASSRAATVKIVVRVRFMFVAPKILDGAPARRSSVFNVVYARAQADRRRFRLARVRLMLGGPGIHAHEEGLTLSVQEVAELRQRVCVDASVYGRALESEWAIAAARQVVDVRRGDIGNDRTPQTYELLIHGLRNVDAFERFEASSGCFAHGACGAQLLQQRRGTHVARSAPA